MSSVNRAIIIGNVGKDPEVRSIGEGKKVASMSVATSDRWTDKRTGEKREAVEWHKVTIFNDQIVKVVEAYVKKGSQVYVSGKIKTRKWMDQQGQDRYTTEIELGPYGAELQILGSRAGNTGDAVADEAKPEINDGIPF